MNSLFQTWKLEIRITYMKGREEEHVKRHFPLFSREGSEVYKHSLFR